MEGTALASLRATWRAGRERARSQDLLLNAAGVTFYATLAAVPAALVAIRVATALAGAGRVLRLARSMADALPTEMGAPRVVLELFARGTDLSWWTVLVALVPASLYGEGMRRALSRFGGADERLVGWRGRLSITPLLVAAPALLLVLLAVTPALGHLFGRGGWGGVGGVVVAFTADWVVTAVSLVWVFRVVSPDPPSWAAAVIGGVLTASFVAGFLQGFVLFLALPIDVGQPFGGLSAVGALCAVELWAWLLHIVVLLGYLATRSFQLRPAPQDQLAPS